ncbi:MAG: potassium transporter TrkG [Victivallaceae bacterium]|nr:potassium transporter TrkG [Victivallaceae bacterium]
MTLSIIKRSQLLFLFSFLALIAVGTVLFHTPWVMRDGSVPSWINALFSATTAVCVTGLTVIPVDQMSLFGQSLTLVLLQLGGIGIMTIGASVVLLVRNSMSFGGAMMMNDLSENFARRRTELLVMVIVRYTLVVELLGAGLLFIGFVAASEPLNRAAFLAVFHSASAFCNAGLSPIVDNVMSLNVFLKVVIMLLIVLGGIGLYAVYDIHCFFRERKPLLIYTKLVLWTTGILIVGGALLLKFIEGGKLQWIDAFFQSVTARTAGFNSVDLTLLSSGSMMVLIVLMLIGGSPGSTAGGMKTTTAALAFFAVLNAFKGNQRVLIWRREVTISNILKALTMLVTFGVLATAGAIVLPVLIPGTTLQGALFEAVSALATVGLSAGATNHAGTGGKLFLILFMFLGRVGPMTMFLFLLGRERSSRLSYPVERIIVG